MAKLGLPGLEHQAAFGRVSLRHGQMDLVLRMTIKSIREVSPPEARHETAGMMSGQLREKIENLARERFRDDDLLVRLQALIDRCRAASKKRNVLLHSAVAKLNGDEVIVGKGDPGTLPTVQALDELAAEIYAVTDELNEARLHGFLKEAIEKSKTIKVGS